MRPRSQDVKGLNCHDGNSNFDFLSRVDRYQGVLQIQPQKFPGDFQDTFNKVPAGYFLH